MSPSTPASRKAIRSTARDWLRAHPYLVGLNTSFVLAGMVLSPIVFPSVSLGLAVFGGALFGMLCTLCATLHLFFE